MTSLGRGSCEVMGVLHDGVRGIRSDTAVVVGVTCHPDVSVLAPVGAPGVLHDPVVAASASAAVADNQHGVVQVVRGARGLIVHSGAKGKRKIRSIKRI